MTINEIAKMAGVSRATVSRYLNQGYVSEEKKEKIRKVIDETGYKPSAQARQLRSRRSKIIGVILPKINSESVGRMVAGISQVLIKEDYQLLLADTQNVAAEELRYLKTFQANQVDGIILIGTLLDKEHYKMLREAKVPVVVLGQQVKGFSCVYHDDYGAAYDMADHILKKAKHTAFFGVTDKDKAAGYDRKKGFLDALKNHPEIVDKPIIAECQFTLESGYEQAVYTFENNPEIDTVFCATDSIAIGVMMYLRKIGKRIPEDVQLSGIGDTMMGKVAAVSMTTAHYYYKTSGEEAANMLLNMIEKEEICKEVKMGYRLYKKQSTR